MWADNTEQFQHEHLRETREQIEYLRIHNEYEYIKKRSIINFLTNERLNVEKHFHDRAYNMLGNIKRFEGENLKSKLNGILNDALAKTEAKLKNKKAS